MVRSVLSVLGHMYGHPWASSLTWSDPFPTLTARRPTEGTAVNYHRDIEDIVRRMGRGVPLEPQHRKLLEDYIRLSRLWFPPEQVSAGLREDVFRLTRRMCFTYGAVAQALLAMPVAAV